MRTVKVEELLKLKKLFPSNDANVKKRAHEAIERMESGNLPFNCKRCGNLYNPKIEMFIFHELCDKCFAEFDYQKMAGRKGEGGDEYFEEVNLWTESLKK
jgi:hypothetical protein